MSSENLATNICNYFPEKQLTQTPRVLTILEIRTRYNKNRATKQTSVMVISLVGIHILKTVARSNLTLLNRICKLSQSYTSPPNYQWSNCYKLEHVAQLCNTPTACSIYGKDHTTKEYPCSAPECRTAVKCSHLPHYCVNYKHAGHESTDSLPQNSKGKPLHNPSKLFTSRTTKHIVIINTTTDKHIPEKTNRTLPNKSIFFFKLRSIGSNQPHQPTVGINTARHIENPPPRTLTDNSWHPCDIHRFRHILLSPTD